MQTDLLPLGHVVVYDKPFTLVAIEPYIRQRDGVETMVYRFSGQCRHPACTVPVSPINSVKTPNKQLGGTTCPEHKGYTSPEAIARAKGWWDTLTPAERKAHRKASADAARAHFAATTPEEREAKRKAHSDAIKAGQARRRALKTTNPN